MQGRVIWRCNNPRQLRRHTLALSCSLLAETEKFVRVSWWRRWASRLASHERPVPFAVCLPRLATLLAPHLLPESTMGLITAHAGDV